MICRVIFEDTRCVCSGVLQQVGASTRSPQVFDSECVLMLAMRMEMSGGDGHLAQVANRQNHVTFRQVVLFVNVMIRVQYSQP